MVISFRRALTEEPICINFAQYTTGFKLRLKKTLGTSLSFRISLAMCPWKVVVEGVLSESLLQALNTTKREEHL
jgi:hypothetical protein